MATTWGVDAGDDLDPAALVIDGLDSVRQRVRQRLRFFRGEWFLDTTLGVPYFQNIFVRPATLELALSTLVDAIQDVEDVVSVRDVTGDIDPETRRFTFVATVETAFGRMDVEEVTP